MGHHLEADDHGTTKPYQWADNYGVGGPNLRNEKISFGTSLGCDGTYSRKHNNQTPICVANDQMMVHLGSEVCRGVNY